MAARGELTVVVVRSGGFAGITRRWSVDRPDPDDDWVALVEACPWDDVGEDPAGRDRFVWRIEARLPQRHHEASVPDSRLTGPWRELVDRVQREGTGAAGPA
ncbi:protealysin inhibitor emfourin [Pseudolysinimonas sp.]|uniref:protealysin inhibitor emfourin n=1 Tax=Pseudolysinimonas sp. TaxID=2680009 RepID=UPI003F82186B